MSQLPATLTEDMEVLLSPGKVEGVRDGEAGKEVLIHWANLPEYEATWEPLEAMVRQFPEFNVEDKVQVWEGSNDTIPVPDRFGVIYRRRK